MTAETETVFIGLGSNLGDSARTLLKAWESLGGQNGVKLQRLSPPFMTSPVDMASHHWFTNAVGQLTSHLAPHEFLTLLLTIEDMFGRRREKEPKGYHDRAIDLDLLYFGSRIIDDPRLTIPHPRRIERLFVLAPMAVIAPDFIDPETGNSVLQMHHDLLEQIASGVVDKQEITETAWP